ncbi:MAG: TolC family protein, partial [Arcobacter sp.]|nr:TolC family protein [Arcobacter sp.]
MKRFLILISFVIPLFGGEINLELKEALNILKQKNLEIKIADFDSQMKRIESKLPNSMRFGKIDATLSAMRSNDAGNAFGFKLQSREASFGDFG